MGMRMCVYRYMYMYLYRYMYEICICIDSEGREGGFRGEQAGGSSCNLPGAPADAGGDVTSQSQEREEARRSAQLGRAPVFGVEVAHDLLGAADVP